MYVSLLLFIGLILLLTGTFWRLFPSSFGRTRYGYKSELSLSSEAHWKLANQYGSAILMFSGTAGVLLGTGLTLLQIHPQADIIICAAACALLVFGLIYLMEKKLKRLVQ